MRIALLVLVLGCGGGSKKASEAPKTDAPTCAAVADALMEMMVKDKEQTPKLRETADEYNKMIRTRCDDDAWTAEARTCLASMKAQADAPQCDGTLTDEQKTNLASAWAARLRSQGAPEPESAGGGAAPPPSPASTSAPPPMKTEQKKEAPKKSKGSPKPGDPCDGGE